MPLTVVLAVGMDAWLLATQRPEWKSAGFVVVPAASIEQAIDHFKGGDFDLILLGQSIPPEGRQKLVHLIRATGARIPLVCVESAPADCSPLSDTLPGNDLSSILTGIDELLARTSSPYWRRGSCL
jgi:hypothetical protein